MAEKGRRHYLAASSSRASPPPPLAFQGPLQDSEYFAVFAKLTDDEAAL